MKWMLMTTTAAQSSSFDLACLAFTVAFFASFCLVSCLDFGLCLRHSVELGFVSVSGRVAFFVERLEPHLVVGVAVKFCTLPEIAVSGHVA